MEQKLIVITGPTASGKTTLSLKIAKKYNGEIISADSRQVYRGMDVGTAKVPISPSSKKQADTKSSIPSNDGITYQGITHHLINVASPKRTFTVVQWKKQAEQAIKKIIKKGKVPVIVGGTAFYIEALLYDLDIPNVAPNKALRKRLEKFSTKKLFEMLQKKDLDRALTIDPHNKRRLIRALEIIEKRGKVPKLTKKQKYNALILGIKRSDDEMRKRINAWVDSIKDKIIPEIHTLRAYGISWQRLENFGLVYRHFTQYLRGNMTKKHTMKKLKTDDWRYAKRQLTYLSRLPVIWVKNQKEAERKIETFLKKN